MGLSTAFAHPDWQATGNAYFPDAARVRGRWWVVRVNSFPDHPMFTLFIGGKAEGHYDDWPEKWGNPSRIGKSALAVPDAEDALRDVLGLEAFGSEDGEPCDNPFCCG